MFKVMRSRVTGQLQSYVLTEQMVTCDRFDADMGTLKTNIQDEFDTQGIDAQIEECKQVRATRYDYLITKTWAPSESPIPAIIIPLIWKVILIILAWAAIVAIAYVGTYAFKELLVPTPKYYCSECGAGPFSTVAELTAHRATAHPELAKYQCPYCGQAFATADELNAHVAECPWKPQAVPDWVPWLVGGIVAIGAVYVVIKIVPHLLRRKTEG